MNKYIYTNNDNFCSSIPSVLGVPINNAVGFSLVNVLSEF